jgi:hypothetical protein
VELDELAAALYAGKSSTTAFSILEKSERPSLLSICAYASME